MQPKGDTFASPLPPGSATVYSCYAGCHLIFSHICSSNSQSTMYVHALIFWCADGWSVHGHHRAPSVHTCTVMSVCMCVCFVEVIDYMYRDGKSVCKFRLVRPWASIFFTLGYLRADVTRLSKKLIFQAWTKGQCLTSAKGYYSNDEQKRSNVNSKLFKCIQFKGQLIY